jgi:glycosyltransferase involved in cell wall biosynthesis
MDPKTGGVSQAVLNIVEGLSELGVENEVLSLDSPLDISIDIITHPIGTGVQLWGYSKKLRPWLISNLPNYDIVIVHGMWLYYGYITNKIGNQLKRNGHSKYRDTKKFKIFLMPHGMLDPYFQKAKGRRLKAIRNIFYWKMIEQNIVNNVDGILFTCREENILARQTFRRYNPKRELVVGLGVKEPPAYDPKMGEEFIKNCPQLSGNIPYILFLSRIHPKKGVDMLIKAYEKISQKLLEHPKFPKLVIAGPGLDSLYGLEMQKMVNNSPTIRNSVFFPGMLAGNAKWGAFYNSSFFVLPSHQENFGIAVVEAMACGKTVVLTRQVNIWREIVDGGGGVAVDDNQQGIEISLEKFISCSNEETKAFGARAFDLFNNEFSILPAARKLLKEITF